MLGVAEVVAGLRSTHTVDGFIADNVQATYQPSFWTDTMLAVQQRRLILPPFNPTQLLQKHQRSIQQLMAHYSAIQHYTQQSKPVGQVVPRPSAPIPSEDVPSGDTKIIESLFKALQVQDISVSKDASQPDELNISLLPYQIEGLKWLQLREKSEPKGGLLCDDMGLGKTVSTAHRRIVLSCLLLDPDDLFDCFEST